MRSRLERIAFLVVAMSHQAAGGAVAPRAGLCAETKDRRTFQGKLESRALSFDAKGRPMVEAVLALAYACQLPLALEFISQDAVRGPVDLPVQTGSVREVITAVVDSAPGYRVDFAHGLVDIYSPEARRDPLNPFNLVVPEYRVAGLDTDMADSMLVCTLGDELLPHSGGCGGSSPFGRWGPLKITLEMHNATVYEILNAIVAQNGRAAWTPINLPRVPELRRRRFFTNFWSIYPLDPPFEGAAVEPLRRLFPPAHGEAKH